MNRTTLDGAACALCGDDSATIDTILVGSRLTDFPLCGMCSDDQVAVCNHCGMKGWMTEATRINGELYCPPCAKVQPGIAECQMEALRRDEQRDAVNEVRR